MLSLYSIVHVAMETSKKSHFTCPSKSFISIFFTCQVSACELQSFSCHDLANDIYSQTAKTVFSHLKLVYILENCPEIWVNAADLSRTQPKIDDMSSSTNVFFLLLYIWKMVSLGVYRWTHALRWGGGNFHVWPTPRYVPLCIRLCMV